MRDRALMRSQYFHPEWVYFAPASACLRIVGIALLTMVVGAVAGVSVVLSLIAATDADTSISAHHALAPAAPVGRAPAISDALGFLPGPMSFPQDTAENVSVSQKSLPAITTVPKAIRIEATARVERASTKKPVSKKRHAGKRWREDRIRQRLAMLERLKPR